jgi:hypothetical protein
MSDNSFEIEDNECNPWEVFEPENSGDVAGLTWAPQATSPMPLEAIHDLFGKIIRTDQHVLIPRRPQKNLVYVTKDFFQASQSPGGLAGDSVKDDVLGFLSLVLSYAKADKTGDSDTSIKDTTSIMPRTDFSSIYKRLKDDGAMPNIQGSLWDMVVTLSCYANDGNTDNAK